MDSSGRVLVVPVLPLICLRFAAHKLCNGRVLCFLESHGICVCKTSGHIALLKRGPDFILPKLSRNREHAWLLSQVIEVAAQQRPCWVWLHQPTRLQRQKEQSLIVVPRWHQHQFFTWEWRSCWLLALSVHSAHMKCKTAGGRWSMGQMLHTWEHAGEKLNPRFHQKGNDLRTNVDVPTHLLGDFETKPRKNPSSTLMPMEMQTLLHLRVT